MKERKKTMKDRKGRDIEMKEKNEENVAVLKETKTKMGKK